MKLTPGKYVNHKFTADQKKARALWRRQQENYYRLMDALMLTGGGHSRKELHDKLDKRLDEIDRHASMAIELFPDVDESFTISSGTI
jgi:activator of 2-hydroxyglutaryl-CoA dehydratase